MKTLLLLLSLCAFTASAQQPIPGLCVTNFLIHVFDTNTTAMNGTNAGCCGGKVFTGTEYLALDCGSGAVFTFSYSGCPTSDTVIGYYQWTCDTSRNCPGGNQGAPAPCSSGGSATITIPKFHSEIYGTFKMTACCSVEWCQLSSDPCVPPLPSPSQTNNPPVPE